MGSEKILYHKNNNYADKNEPMETKKHPITFSNGPFQNLIQPKHKKWLNLPQLSICQKNTRIQRKIKHFVNMRVFFLLGAKQPNNFRTNKILASHFAIKYFDRVLFKKKFTGFVRALTS